MAPRPPAPSAERVRRVVWLIAVYAMGTLAGALFARLGTPLPWFSDADPDWTTEMSNEVGRQLRQH